MRTAWHVIFGTGAIGLATYDAPRRRGHPVRLVKRSGHAPGPDNVAVVGGDARDAALTTAVAQGARLPRRCPGLRPTHHFAMDQESSDG